MLGSFLVTLPGAPPALAGVEGAQVREGQASIAVDGAHTTITTETRQTIIDYSKFGVGVDETMRIQQPDAGSKILNRVQHGGEGSRIDGELWSNGTVYILNPSGVFFGDRAIVDVGGLVAGAGALSNDDFLSGVDRFTELNGEIGVAPGASLRAARDVVLVGRRVENLGSILAEAGMIAIVAGEKVILAPMHGRVSVHVDGPAEAPAEPAKYAIEQGGNLQAERVTLSAGDTYSLAMNHTGVTRAGEIQVNAGDEGLVQLAGTLDASNLAPGGQGGSIDVRAGKIAVLDATLDASGAEGGGEILVGGDVRGSGAKPKARRLYVGPNAKLRADATLRGDGGKIVMYSSERTAFQGAVSARGGAQGGDGGFVEISGAQLESQGEITLAAPAGKAGTLLYDPDVIEIVGGTQDGSDNPDASDVAVVGSSLGEVLSGNTVEGGGNFIIRESEIEGSDANIILEAVNRIFASGNFDANANGEGLNIVALQSGRSLTMRTTGSTAPSTPTELGIDLVTQATNGEALTWQVSNGGQIELATNLNLPATETPGAPKSSIRVGRLVADGLAYITPPDAGPSDLMTPDLTELTPGNEQDAISVTTQRGDIAVASIVADGQDSEDGKTASPGRRILLQTRQGEITVGTVSAVGGSATTEQETRGELGGVVRVLAAGNATIEGAIDVSGGNGIAGAQFGDFPLLDGGGGGGIQLSARGTGAQLNVKGNLTAKGGTGEGSFLFDPEVGDTITLEADGGTGGQVSLEAEGNLTVQADPGDPQVVIDVSGADGTGSGGSAITGGTDDAIRIVHGPDADTAGDAEVNAILRANGGNARQSFGGGTPVVGGEGGSGGNITVAANGGKLLASNMTIVANGGSGSVGVDADGTPLVDDTGFIVGSGGGSTGQITLSASKDVLAGSVQARGGNAVDSVGGAGANVTIQTIDPDEASSVTLAGAIDVSGGTATRSAAKDVVLDGGRAGGVNVLAPVRTANAEVTGVGSVFLSNVIGGRGGDGVVVDAAGGTTATRADSASISVDATGDLELGAAASAESRFEGGNLRLSARNIGAAPSGPIRIAGTGQDEDNATLTTGGTLHADIFDNSDARSLGRVEMQLTKTEGQAQLTRAGALLATSSASAGTTPHTLTKLGRGNDSDPTLAYRLNVTTPASGTQPVLLIQQGAIDLGTAGGAVVNGDFPTNDIPVATNRGAIEGGAGGGLLGSTRGDLRFEGSTIGSADNALLLDGDRTGDRDGDGDGDGGAALSLDAKGNVFVNVVSSAPTSAFGAIDIVQRSEAGKTEMDLDGNLATKEVNIAADPVVRVHTITSVDTTGSQSAFGYEVDAGAVDVQLHVDRLRLGGRGLLASTGNLVLTDAALAEPAITTGGNDLTLVSFRGSIQQESPDAVAVDFSGPGTPDQEDEDPARLAFFVNAAAGSATHALRTRGMQGLAGLAADGGAWFVNTPTAAAPDLRIERITNFSPRDLGQTGDDALTVFGVRAQDGNLEITQQSGRIVLGELRDAPEFTDAHLDASGNIVLNAPDAEGGIEIENARFFRTLVPVIDDETGEQEVDDEGLPVFETVFLRLNDARIHSSNGDVTLGGTVNTSVNSIAQPNPEDSGEEGAPTAPEFVHASLRSEAGGTVRFRGDVGRRGDEQAPLAVLDTTGATVEGVRSFEVGDAHFRGKLDGPGSAAILARDLDPEDSEASADHEASVNFDGDVGAGQALTRLEVDAERIRFTSTDRVVVGDDGIHLDTHQATIPQVATISDTLGGLRISTTGDFAVGNLDKLSVAGPLTIEAPNVHVTDVSATRIAIDSPHIVLYARPAGPVELRNGETVTDQGVDIVADQINLASVPTVDPATAGGPTPTFGLGSGGIVAPGSLSQFRVIRFTQDVEGVDRELFFGEEGRILDLTATGSTLIGNPSTEIPRERPETVPSLPPRFSEQAPAPPPPVDTAQVLAFLRCGDSGSLTSCDAQTALPLATLEDFANSSLATPRAAELAERYRALRANDLSAAFDEAGAGFRKQSGFGEFDPVAFGNFLEASPEHSAARSAIRELAVVMVEVDLLGLPSDVETQIREGMASDLAHEADLPGFDTDAVFTAIAATPIGLPPPQPSQSL